MHEPGIGTPDPGLSPVLRAAAGIALGLVAGLAAAAALPREQGAVEDHGLGQGRGRAVPGHPAPVVR